MAKGIAHRDWALHRFDYDSDQEFNVAVQQEMALAQHIMDRLGVAIVSAPIRRRGPVTGRFYTEAVVFETATVPAAREPGAGEVVEVDGNPADHDLYSALVEDADDMAHVE
jgi:hypothetical protein